jgi:hypothetical protein
MKQYICLNTIDCSWADENPPRQFSLPDTEENVCPNCESSNIREAIIEPKKLPWLIPTALIGALCLASIVWWLWPLTPPPPLMIKVLDLNCQTGVLSLTTVGGNDSPVTFEIEGLGASKNNEFKIFLSKRYGKSLKLFAIQNGVSIDTMYTTHCPEKGGQEKDKDHGESWNTDAPKAPPVKWTRVTDSDFCVGECILAYSETDNLGHIRERKVENYAKCCPADK